MSQKGIIINTADSGHVDASDHAILFQAIFGRGGILNVGKKLEISKISNNKIRIYDGVYMMANGVPIRVEEYIDLDISSGTLGFKRKDIIIAEYIKNGNGDGNDVAQIRVVAGEYSSSNPELPKLINNSTTAQELIYTLMIDETTMSIYSTDSKIAVGLESSVYIQK